MLNVCWRTFRRALPICTAWWLALSGAVVAGWTIGKLEDVPPAVAVTPAPSGSGQLGRRPVAVKTEAPKPTRPKWTPPRPEKRTEPRRTKRPRPTPTGSPATPPSSEGPTPETSPLGEPATPKAPTPTP